MKKIINIKYIKIIYLFILIFSVVQAECPENFIESTQSTPDDIVCLPELFEHNITAMQASYYMVEVEIDGSLIDSDDWVGAFYNDICVGTQLWDTSQCVGLCPVIVFGDDSGDYAEGYPFVGDIPTFKIYDVSENIYYEGNTLEPAAPWDILNISVIDLLLTIIC